MQEKRAKSDILPLFQRIQQIELLNYLALNVVDVAVELDEELAILDELHSLLRINGVGEKEPQRVY